MTLQSREVWARGDQRAPRRSIEAESAQERRSRLIGIGLYCGALFTFTGTDASAKWLSHTLPVLEIVWVRYLVSALFVFAAINPIARPRVFATRRPGLQALRSLLIFGSTANFFMALRSLPLAESTSIGFSQPLLIALFAGPFLGEWVGPRRLVAICIGFLGVLVVTKPGNGLLQPAMLFALAGVLCNSCYYIATRRLAASDPPVTTLAYTTVLRRTGCPVIATDLYDRGYGEAGYDFLKPSRMSDNIVTNPPYNAAEGFVRSCVGHSRQKFALLLRLAFLEGANRQRTIFTKYPPSRVWVFSERITFYPAGATKKGTGTTAYAWFVWDKESPSSTELKWFEPGYKRKYAEKADHTENPMLFK